MKRKRNGVIVSAVLLATLLILALFIKGPLRSPLIIQFGIRSFRTFSIVSWAFVGAGGVIFILASASFFREAGRAAISRNREEMTRKELENASRSYSSGSDEPEVVRLRLEELRKENPSLTSLVSRCIAQMDEMDDLQRRQKGLIESNDAIYLNDTIELLDNTERHICRNFRGVINRCMVLGKGEEMDISQVETPLIDNESRLKDAATLLRYSADWINKYNEDSSDKSRSELDAWISIIKETLEG